MSAQPLVAIIDDDDSVRESLPDPVRELGFAARTFASAEAFLASDCVGQTRCLILDIAMPGMSGPDLHHELTLRGYRIPVIFITAQTDERLRAHLLEHGAVECLRKPLNHAALVEALKTVFRSGENTASFRGAR
jgi:FixJ family two-component response regulator